ncbi:MaoC/PaaZ C-terminal domain-containing protein [Corynebacterium breve]|uniref:MaoC/PaaZ C-terminal domain-containing protein n=1 Tax=Corynebacterium breve TaxID=3049799 RepID=A0ABY8VEX8_9CORY|nr:MaoC/PaaZ C-terminal domain-containing protein [Corynebacterium breve]WIM67657.1 MaoC/PaaZ C-terminal domain-containing protein [Corynebacterium breve]
MSSKLKKIAGQAKFFATALRPTASRKPAWSGAPVEGAITTDFQQDLAKLATYQDICGFSRSEFVPSTWLHVQTFPLQTEIMGGRDWPFPILGTVHVANQMRQFRPVRIDEELFLCVQVGQLYPHRRGTIVTMNGTIMVDKELVWAGRSDYLIPGYEVPGQPHKVEQEELPVVEAASSRQLGADLGRKYAKVSGDYNPIHLSAASAKMFGFKSAIAHGMWTHAWALAAQEDHLPDAYETRVQFSKPVALPSTVHFLRDGERYGVVSDDGKMHLAGHIRPLSEREMGRPV